jgi:hypothetical protein
MGCEPAWISEHRTPRLMATQLTRARLRVHQAMSGQRSPEHAHAKNEIMSFAGERGDH